MLENSMVVPHADDSDETHAVPDGLTVMRRIDNKLAAELFADEMYEQFSVRGSDEDYITALVRQFIEGGMTRGLEKNKVKLAAFLITFESCLQAAGEGYADQVHRDQA